MRWRALAPRHFVVFLCLSVFLLLVPRVLPAQQGLCATVSIQIQQKVSLERQAFTAELDINNGLTTDSITSVGVNLLFTDATGTAAVATSDPNNTTAQFFLRQDSLSGINATDGTGTIGPSTNAVMRWLIIPAPGTGGTVPTGEVYFVGASLSYTLADQVQTVSVNPASIVVVPQPMLQLDYFLPSDVYADDPFTPEIEPPVPFTLGVRVTNVGAGTAHGLTIASAQPKLVDNQQGLLIGFQITDSYVDDRPAADTLLINFGDVAPSQSRIGRWDMETTLSGQFVEFNASFSHADSLGGALTSVINAANTHTLIHDILVDLPGRDGVLDFLARDADVPRVYESDNVVDPVNEVSSNSTIGPPNGSGQVAVTVPVTTGLVYAQLPDPFAGQLAAITGMRSDGKTMPPSNVWFSKTRNGGGGWSYYVNLFDTNTTGHYVLNGTAIATNSSIAGSVFNDANGDGLLDNGEAGIGAVDVHLHGATATTTIDLDALTDSSGNYQFSSLAAGTYALSIEPIAQYGDGTAIAGTAGGTPSIGSITNIVLPASAATSGYAFPKIQQVSSATADFALTSFSVSAANVTIGNNVTLTTNLSNLGPAADSGSVSLLIPSNVAILASLPSTGSFDAAARVWHIGTMNAGDMATLTLTLQGKTAGAITLSAFAVADAGASDPNPQNNSGSAALTINPPASFTISKTAPAIIATKGTLNYSIGLGNNGQNTTGTAAIIADALPSGVTYVNATPGPGVASVACSGATNLVCSVGLAAGLPAGSANGTATFTIQTTAPDTAGSITNFASVDAAGGASPPVPGIGCAPAATCGSATTTVKTAAAITLTKTGPADVLAGTPVAYTMALGNSGELASGTTITVADTLPTGMSFASATAGQGVSTVACTGTNNLTCTVTLNSALQPGASNGAAAFTINTTAPLVAGSITNAASVDATAGTNPPSPGIDCTPVASCASATTLVTTIQNVTLSKAGPASVLAYATVPYTIALGNSGTAASSTTITVADALPMGMAFVNAVPGPNVATVICTGTTLLTCSANLASALPPGAANGAAAFTINATAPPLAGTAINYASVDALGSTNAPVPGAECVPQASCSSATTTVNPAPYITLTKMGPANAATGVATAYMISLGNAGQAPSGTTLTVADALPNGMSFISATPGIDVSSVLCSGSAPLKCTVTLGAPLPGGAPNGAAAFTINTIAPSAAGTITNSASVDATGGSNPPAPGASCTTASCGSVQTAVTATSTTNLTLAAMAPASAVENSAYTYTLRIGNSGTVASGKTVTVREVLPPGVTVSAATAGAGVLSVDCGVLPLVGDGTTPRNCTVTLKSGIAANTDTNVNGTAMLTLTATANALGLATNYASVDAQGGSAPPTPGTTCTTTSCTAVATQVVSQSAMNLTLVKSGTANIGVNTPYTYTFSVGNSGASASSLTLTIADVLPMGVTITDAEPALGISSVDCGTLPRIGDGRSPLTCTVMLGAAIPPGATNGNPAVVLTASASATGKLTNYASIDATGGVHPATPGPNCASPSACSSWATQVHAAGPPTASPNTQLSEVAVKSAAPVPVDTRALLLALALVLLGAGTMRMKMKKRRR